MISVQSTKHPQKLLQNDFYIKSNVCITPMWVQWPCSKQICFSWLHGKTSGFLLLPKTKCDSTVHTHTHTHTQPFNGTFSRTTRVSRYQKAKTNLDFTVAKDSEWQWHQLGHMQICTSLQTDNHAGNPPLSFLQAGCPSCRPANSVKALKG